MKTDVVLAGVGGQGVLSAGALVAHAALRDGWGVKQSEEHGMAQRGGSVLAFLRISDRAIASEVVPQGTADLVIATEPLEALRAYPFLSKDGWLVTASEPVANLEGYPPEDELLARIAALPNALVVPASRLAREAGVAQAVNVVLVGAALHRLPISAAAVEAELTRAFESHGQRVLQGNLRALEAGQEAAACPLS